MSGSREMVRPIQLSAITRSKKDGEAGAHRPPPVRPVASGSFAFPAFAVVVIAGGPV